MAKIRFEFDGISTTVALPALVGLRPTLLEVARDHRIPLLFNCEVGACGACIVDIETIRGTPAGMTEAEAFFLAAIGNGDRQGSTGARLACQYRPGADEEICVRFASALCSF
ncbi:MAG: (2Fe-2S)-binding protein [Rhodospirillales bacterium]|nr:(2Fe-2S)-binding protein [Rhodospirillales bacterium]